MASKTVSFYGDGQAGRKSLAGSLIYKVKHLGKVLHSRLTHDNSVAGLGCPRESN